MHDPEKRILTKATAKVQGRKGKQTREQNVEAENLVNKEWLILDLPLLLISISIYISQFSEVSRHFFVKIGDKASNPITC